MAVQIEGASYRLRQQAELVPEHIRSKALIRPAFGIGHHTAEASQSPAQGGDAATNRTDWAVTKFE
jgi:hypothetical protein